MNYRILHGDDSTIRRTIAAKFWAPSPIVAQEIARSYVARIGEAAVEAKIAFKEEDYDLKEC